MTSLPQNLIAASLILPFCEHPVRDLYTCFPFLNTVFQTNWGFSWDLPSHFSWGTEEEAALSSVRTKKLLRVRGAGGELWQAPRGLGGSIMFPPIFFFILLF